MLLMGVANARPPLRVPNRISDFYVHCSGTHQIKRADLKSDFPIWQSRLCWVSCIGSSSEIQFREWKMMR